MVDLAPKTAMLLRFSDGWKGMEVLFQEQWSSCRSVAEAGCREWSIRPGTVWHLVCLSELPLIDRNETCWTPVWSMQSQSPLRCVVFAPLCLCFYISIRYHKPLVRQCDAGSTGWSDEADARHLSLGSWGSEIRDMKPSLVRRRYLLQWQLLIISATK